MREASFSADENVLPGITPPMRSSCAGPTSQL
jgi:hypothetical protein